MSNLRHFCSNIKYWNFGGICFFKAPNYYIQKSIKVTKTYSGQKILVIGYTTIPSGFDPDGQFVFRLKKRITEMNTQSVLGMDSCQKQVSGVHSDLPGIEKKNPPKTICYGSSPKQTLSSFNTDSDYQNRLYNV